MTTVGKYKAAIFDCDGTLVDSESIWMTMIQEVLLQHHLEPHPEFVEEFRGITSTKAAQKIALHTGKSTDEVKDALDVEYSARLRSGSVPMANASTFLHALHGAVPIAVASNGRREDVEALLSTTGLIGFIDVIVTIEDVTQGKPAPDLFELACKRLAVQPAHSVVFEDSLIGVGAAKAAKCNVIGMTTDPAVEAEAGNIAPGFDCLDVKITGQEFYVQIKDRILK